jgi:hypothetical protein
VTAEPSRRGILPTVVCHCYDVDNSRMRRPWPEWGCCPRGSVVVIAETIPVQKVESSRVFRPPTHESYKAVSFTIRNQHTYA